MRSMPAIHELTYCFEQLAGDQDVRAVVLTGAGASFCGGDVNWMRSSLDLTWDENIADAGRLAAMLDAINSVPRSPSLDAHQRRGGGRVLAVACCDIAIAVDGAKFGFREVKLIPP